MSSDLVEVRVTDNVGTIVLNRPQHGNTLARLMVGQIADAIEDLYREKRVRAIVLTGAGSSFCEGQDLEEIYNVTSQHGDWSEGEHRWGEDAEDYRELITRMLETTKPIIAAVNGPAWSTGAGLVLASDIAIASTEATFGTPDTRRGLVAGLVAPLLCHRVGGGQATRLLLTSSIISADEALQLGVFHELVNPDLVWARAAELGRECAEGAPQAVQITKRLLTETVGEQLISHLTAGAIMQATSFTTEAAQEGIAAFLEQRKPDWK